MKQVFDGPVAHGGKKYFHRKIGKDGAFVIVVSFFAAGSDDERIVTAYKIIFSITGEGVAHQESLEPLFYGRRHILDIVQE